MAAGGPVYPLPRPCSRTVIGREMGCPDFQTGDECDGVGSFWTIPSIYPRFTPPSIAHSRP